MAHNLETRNGQTSFVAVGQTAWHGLGTYVNEAITAEQAIEMANLNYTVEKKPVQVVGGDIMEGYAATVRTDTNEHLGLVTDKYTIVQNTEVFSFFDSIIDKGEAIYQTAGVLGKGEKIFVTAKLPSDILVKGEEVNNYLLLTSGHDGKTAIQAGFTSIRVVCNNTLTAALQGLKNKVTIQHYKNAKQKLNVAAQVMGLASKYIAGLDTTFNKMAETKISDLQFRDLIELTLNPKKEQITSEEFSTRFNNRVDDIMHFAHNHYTQQTEAAKGTLWGAYNAISGWYGWQKNYDSQEAKMKDLHYGGASAKIETAFSIAQSMLA